MIGCRDEQSSSQGDSHRQWWHEAHHLDTFHYDWKWQLPEAIPPIRPASSHLQSLLHGHKARGSDRYQSMGKKGEPSSLTHLLSSYTTPAVLCAVGAGIKVSEHLLPPCWVVSPASIHHLTSSSSLLFSPSSSPDPGHPGDQRQCAADGRHADGAGRQRQLGGGVQSPDHHTPPHGARQRGEATANTLMVQYCDLCVNAGTVLDKAGAAASTQNVTLTTTCFRKCCSTEKHPCMQVQDGVLSLLTWLCNECKGVEIAYQRTNANPRVLEQLHLFTR